MRYIYISSYLNLLSKIIFNRPISIHLTANLASRLKGIKTTEIILKLNS